MERGQKWTGWTKWTVDVVDEKPSAVLEMICPFLSTVHKVHLVHNVHLKKPMNRYDDKKNYCRMLGHSVSFLYCRRTAQNTPCRKIKDCWFESLPIDEYINAHFSVEEQQRIFKDPEPKITSLLDLIAQAKSRAEGSEDS